jgi:hypothetical protein
MSQNLIVLGYVIGSEKFDDTRSRKSKIPKGKSEAVNIRYQRGKQKP